MDCLCNGVCETDAKLNTHQNQTEKPSKNNSFLNRECSFLFILDMNFGMVYALLLLMTNI